MLARTVGDASPYKNNPNIPDFAKKLIGRCVKLNGIDIKSFWLDFFKKLLFARTVGDAGPYKIDCSFLHFAKKTIVWCVKPNPIDIESFLPLFFSKKRAGLGAAPYKAK